MSNCVLQIIFIYDILNRIVIKLQFGLWGIDKIYSLKLQGGNIV